MRLVVTCIKLFLFEFCIWWISNSISYNNINEKKNVRSCFTFGRLLNTSRAVHGSGQVGFVPNPNLTRNFWVGENKTPNQLGMLVGSSGFKLYRSVSSFVAGVVIWPDLSRSGQITMRSRQTWIRSQQDIAGSSGFFFCHELQMISEVTEQLNHFQ